MGMGWMLDYIISEVFYNLSDSMILWNALQMHEYETEVLGENFRLVC